MLSRPCWVGSMYFCNMASHVDIIKSLHVLLRIFVRGQLEVNSRCIQGSYGSRHARITYIVDGELWVVNVIPTGQFDIRDASKFDLSHPRSLGAVVRSFCRRLGQDMPSFESIDEVLAKGPPAWMLEE